MHSLIAWRYFKSKKSTNAINIISWVCITAIMVGTAALIIVLSVFNGFEGLVKSLYNSFYPDIKITATTGKTIILNPIQLKEISNTAGIRFITPVIEEKAIFQNYGVQKIVQLKGVTPSYAQVNNISAYINNKQKFDIGTTQEPKLVVGNTIAEALGISVSKEAEPVTVYIPRKSTDDNTDLMSSISSDNLKASGTFSIQQEFDDKYALTQLAFMKDAMQMGADEYTAVEISVDDSQKVESIKESLFKKLGVNFTIQNRYEQNQNLYAVMNTERWLFFAVLSLILVVAAFNMIGALTMLVVDKQKDIAIFNALGASQGFIKKVYLTAGLLLGFIGTVLGLIISISFVLLQKKYHLISLPQEGFVIDYFPVELRVTDIITVIITVGIISLLASWFPAHKASKNLINLKSE